ncbi:MAG: hypothetical protein ACUVV4_04705 [Candidatus Bathyarchaeia archaeon]
MPCLHQNPRDLHIPDWEQQQDLDLIICKRCSRVLEIRLAPDPMALKKRMHVRAAS